MAEWFWVSLGPFLLSIAWSGVSAVWAPGRGGDGAAAHRPAGRWPWLWVGVGCLLQAAVGVSGLALHTSVTLWTLPAIPVFGSWTFRVDPLSSLLLLLLGVIGATAACVAADLARHRRAGTGRTMAMVTALQFLFTSFLVTATDAVPFLIAWEAMSLCAYGYLLPQHHHRPSRRAAYVTVVVSELGFLLLVLAFLLSAPLQDVSSTGLSGHPFAFTVLQAHLSTTSPDLRNTVFGLALMGFGAKSGILPLQAWMPEAYDAAPPHLNAILAGGLLNLGLFGVLRVLAVSPPTLVIGIAVLWLGVAAVFAGALFAVIENRMRRLLAYSSVENVGWMVISIGLAISFADRHNAADANLAMMGLLVQMVSHGMAKALAFLTAGEVSRRAGTSDLDHLGGLLGEMPALGVSFLFSCLTLAAVAPFSGFVSEWMTLQGMLQVYRSLTPALQVVVTLGGMVAAAGSALAMTTFLKLFAFAMTGQRRWSVTRLTSSQTGRLTGFGIGILTVLCALYGWFPTFSMSAYEHVITAVVRHPESLTDIVPNVAGGPHVNATIVSLGGAVPPFLPAPGLVIQPADFVATIGPTYVLGWFIVWAAFGLLLIWLPRRRAYRTRVVPAWLGGREHRAAQSQYTSSAYANPYRMLWAGLLRYRIDRQWTAGVPEVPRRLVVRRAISLWLSAEPWRPVVRQMRRGISAIRRWQHGQLWGYLLTILAGAVCLLAWAILY
ncbi:MAG: hypothetical protein K6T78_03025 [Alicyclobacillus sp.]|nr:hypothetical protein [Alicyclobacillus sp.]